MNDEVNCRLIVPLQMKFNAFHAGQRIGRVFIKEVCVLGYEDQMAYEEHTGQTFKPFLWSLDGEHLTKADYEAVGKALGA